MTTDLETPTPADAADDAPHEQASPHLIVAGIGASAGGVHDSELHEILARGSSMGRAAIWSSSMRSSRSGGTMPRAAIATGVADLSYPWPSCG